MIIILRQIILNVTIAGIFSVVMLSMVQKSALQEVIRLAVGMLMIYALLTPLSSFSIPSFSGIFFGYREQAARETMTIQKQNEEITSSSFGRAISKYIQDEAIAAGIECQIETSLRPNSEGELVIDSITVYAVQMSDEERVELSAIIQRNCGVGPEQQFFAEG